MKMLWFSADFMMREDDFKVLLIAHTSLKATFHFGIFGLVVHVIHQDQILTNA